MALRFQVAMDCSDPHTLVEFWAAALHYEVEQQDPTFIMSMIDSGHATLEDTVTIDGGLRWRSGAAATDPDGVGPRLFFQLVPEQKVGKNRTHLDVRTADRIAEVARLEALGAKQVHDGEQGPHTWTTMTDPEGNEFCVS